MWGGERVATRAGGDGAGEVVVEMGIYRARDVTSLIVGEAPRGVGQVEPAIDDNPIRIGEMLGKLMGAD